MNDLVTLHNGQLVTTTLAIAEGTENEHASVIALARKYQKDLEEFGPCRFEIDVVKRPQAGECETPAAGAGAAKLGPVTRQPTTNREETAA